MSEHIERRGRPRKWASIPLADWMKSSGIRAEALADDLEVDHSTVYRWLRGEQLPEIETAWKIVDIARKTDSGRKLTLEAILKPRLQSAKPQTRGERNGVFPRSTSEARNRRLATATE